MVLIEWDTADKQRELLRILQKDDTVHNHVVDTAIRYSDENRYPFSCIRCFSTELSGQLSPTYVFVYEEKNAFVHARPPPRGHDETLLRSALAELIDKCIGREGQMQIKGDTNTKDMLQSMPLTRAHLATAEVFYMTDEQMRVASEMELPLVPGFTVENVDLERDLMTIHDNWAAYLQYLPSSVVRDASTGQAVSWIMSSPMGEFANLFTLPEYRGKGLARLVELHLIKTFASQGLRPYKYVNNFEIRMNSRKNPLWTSWNKRTAKDREEEKKEEGEPDYYQMHLNDIKIGHVHQD